MSFISRVRQVIKQMGSVDSQRIDEAPNRSQIDVANHLTHTRTLGNMR